MRVLLATALLPVTFVVLNACSVPETNSKSSGKAATSSSTGTTTTGNSSKQTGVSSGTESATGTETETAADTDTETGTGSDIGSGTETSSSTGTTKSVTPIGTITGESTTLANFAGKSAYAYTASTTAAGKTYQSLIFTVTNQDVDASMFKAVDHYTCTPCEGSDDTHCQSGAASTVSAIFSGKLTTSPAGYAATAAGFPVSATNSLLQLPSFTNPNYVADATANAKAGFSISASADQQTGAVASYGTFNFTGALPTASGQEFTVKPVLTFPDGKTYTATWQGTVYTMPAQPTAPTCGANHYLLPTYKP